RRRCRRDGGAARIPQAAELSRGTVGERPRRAFRRRDHAWLWRDVQLRRPGAAGGPVGDRCVHPRAPADEGAAMNRERALLAGVVGLVGCAIGLVFAPRDALVAWLVCWLGWGSIPIGSLAVLMLVALIPGTWRQLYARPLVIGATLMPLVAIAMIPLLVGVELIYPWT